MSFPVGDWQFWVVSALALCAAIWLVRGVVRFAVHTRRGSAAPKRATLTIDGRPAPRSKDDPA